MSDDVSKRVMEAADALVSAFDALREAKLALEDQRLAAQDGARGQGFVQASQRLETAARRSEEALRKSFVAAAVDREILTYNRFRLADARLASARGELKTNGRNAYTPEHVSRLNDAAALIERGLDAVKDLLFIHGSDGAQAQNLTGSAPESAVFSAVKRAVRAGDSPAGPVDAP